MRIALDLQAAQSEASRHRGVGRGTLAFVKALLTINTSHQFEIILNAHYPDAIADIKSQLSSLAANLQWREYTYPLLDKPYSRKVAQTLVAHTYAISQPDVLYLANPFEGHWGKAVSPIWHSHATNSLNSGMLHDLIPLIFKEIYLSDTATRYWYHQRLNHVKNTDLLLAQSSSSRSDGIQYLDFAPEKIVNIRGAVDEQFKPVTLTSEEKDTFLHRYNIEKKIILYTGGIDFRKNIEGLIQAFSLLPHALRHQHQLVIVCKTSSEEKNALLNKARQCGLSNNELLLTGFIPDHDLVIFYNLCHLFIFPSLYEGFGLPVLEAMSCGAPTIGSDISSIPEIMNCKEALFDPHSIENMALHLTKSLQDDNFLSMRSRHGLQQSKAFSWEKSAKTTLSAWEEAYARKKRDHTLQTVPRAQLTHDCIRKLADILSQHTHTHEDLTQIEKAFICNDI